MKYVVSYSGGLGSFGAAVLTKAAHGADACRLVFTDTLTEDEDLYRFLDESTAKLGIELTKLQDGRNIWQVFADEKYHGNSRIDPCSKILKRQLFRKWIEGQYRPGEATIVFGIGPNESHRMNAIRERWKPYDVTAPLIDAGHDREQILDELDALKILPPRLYEMGFEHNNCGGFCVKTGQRQMLQLLRKLPERYREHEQQQEELFVKLGCKHPFIRRVVKGKMSYLSLKEFRELIERGEKADGYSQAGCGCFV